MVNARVVDASGNAASIVSLHAEGSGPQQALIQLDAGTQVLVPLDLLGRQDDGSYRLPFTFHGGGDGGEVRIPVLAEELQVGKRTVDTGRGVRLHKQVVQHEELLDQPLLRDELVVAHVPVGRIVQPGEVPDTRYEGDTLVMPVFEEVLVVQKQLLLKEEVHVTRRRQEVRSAQKVMLRTEQVKVERFE
jgi:uncharacterized protein (TIGR02271 family)